MNNKIQTVKRISLIVGLAALLVVILVNFLPILNIRLDGVESDYTFGAPGGHNFLGWQAIFYWWGPSIFIGGVSAFNFNIWLFLGMFLPLVALIVDSVMLKKALYRKKATVELIAAAAMFFGAFIFSSAPYFATKSVGNHLVAYMKMAIEQGTFTLGWFCYVMVTAMLIGCAVKVWSAIFSLKNEAEAENEAIAAFRAQDPVVVAKKHRVRATAIMTSYNRVGGVWSGASAIVSGILRTECGFTGTSYTDAGGTINGYMNTDMGLHTLGTDVCLLPNQSPEATLKSCLRDKDSATTVYCLQDAAHRRLYNMVNSNAVIGLTPGTEVSYGEAPWQTGLKIGWVVLAILELAGAAAIFSTWRKKED